MSNAVLKCRLMWVLWYYVSNLQSVSELNPQLQDILKCGFNFDTYHRLRIKRHVSDCIKVFIED